ncbi:MAG: hypothetical protein ACUVRV_10395 [Cyanobacteriota bacterium]
MTVLFYSLVALLSIFPMFLLLVEHGPAMLAALGMTLTVVLLMW